MKSERRDGKNGLHGNYSDLLKLLLEHLEKEGLL